MKFWEIFRFETLYQLSRFSTWIYFVIGLGLSILITVEFVDAVRSGDYYLNSPMAVMGIVCFASIFGLLLAAAVSSDAATKDAQSRIEPLIFTSPLSKFNYLGNKFFGAIAISLIFQVIVILFLALLPLFPKIDPAFFGPFQLMGYINSFFLIALPNTFIVTALLFSVAAISRMAMTSYFMAVVLFFLALFSGEIFAALFGWWEVGKVVDFTGFTILKELKITSPPAEVKSGLVGLEPLLLNRVVWLTIALGTLVLTSFRFSFSHHVAGNFLKRLFKPKPVVFIPSNSEPVSMPVIPQSFDAFSRYRQTLHLSWHYFLEAFLGWGWFIILVMAVVLGMFLTEVVEGSLGVPALPTTGRIASAMNQLTFKILVVALITVYAGKIIWSERDTRVSDISDIMPLPDWLQLFSKFLGLVFLIVAIQVFMMGTGIIVQVIKEYYVFDFALYLTVFFGLQFLDYLLFAVVAMAVHVLVNQKYVGHTVVFVSFLYTVFAAKIGVEHNLLIYGADPGWTHLEMQGFGESLTPWFWFKFYWVCWAVILALVTRLFWIRGKETAGRWRIRIADSRATPELWKTAAAALVLLFTLGSFVFYNTNILNDYTSNSDVTDRHAAYEKRYSQYRVMAQPSLTATSLKAEIYPEKREATIQGLYTLENKSEAAIDTILLATDFDVETRGVTFDRQAKQVVADEEVGHSMYVLSKPLQPGDSIKLRFEILFKTDGFSNTGDRNPVAHNGTYFVKNQGMPEVGYQIGRELDLAAHRQKYDLPPRAAAASLYDVAARHNTAGREKIRFEAILGTAADQIAVAPGKLHKAWKEKGRNYFHYKTDTPIKNIYGLLSSSYAMREFNWKDVNVKILYHPGHTLNLKRIEQSIQASLNYYTKHFGPYQHKQLTFVEYPNASTGATAYPGTVAFTEGYALLNPLADYREFDLPFAVAAHEIGHQWWAHQVGPANVEGAPVLSESLAWYSALGVVEEAYGTEHLQRLMAVMRDSYLTPRSKADVPLMRATDFFQAYRKGPFAMYALREYVGEVRVNGALRSMIKKHSSGEPPLPTSLDLYRELSAVTPDSMMYLLTDLFEKNTFWEVETKEAQAEQTGKNTWRVELDVVARKIQVDTAGVETETPMNEFVEIGVYADEPAGKKVKPLHLRMHSIRSGRQRITVMVSGKPAQTGIDPRNLLIDVNVHDNMINIKEVGSMK